jgi:tRNA threonylcarbamoyl adenosine modification protein (Sua5/YciO/YrdC/YwlC family)
VCYDLSDLSHYTKSISNPLFRILKNHLPGAFTFILPANKEVPKILKSKKDTIGLRVPDNDIARAIVKELGHPILSTSLPGEMVEEYTDPNWIYEKFKNQVEIVVSGGIGNMLPSTVVDLTTPEPSILRNGAGVFAV